MNGVFLIALLGFSCAVPTTADFDFDKLLNEFATLIVEYIEVIFKDSFKDFQLWGNGNLNLTFESQIEGTVSFKRIYVFGLDGLLVSNKTINIKWDSNDQTLIFGLNISIPNEVGIRVEEYDMDFGVFNVIPFYGNGNFSAGTYSVNTDIYAKISFGSSLELTYFELRPFLSGAKFELSGFWRNSELSNLISQILTVLFDGIVLVWDFEVDCITCFISSTVESLVNNLSFWDHFQERCQNVCLPSNIELINLAFVKNITEFWDTVSKDDVAGYIETGVEYFSKEIECYLADN